MGFNLGNALAGAVTGFMETGNPWVGAAMGAAGAFGGSTNLGNVAGGLGNGAMGLLNAQSEGFQVAMYGEQLRHQEHMQFNSQAFNEMIDEKSENMREANTLRDVQMSQFRADNQIVKKFVQMIGE